jgi:hypothetical protein
MQLTRTALSEIIHGGVARRLDHLVIIIIIIHLLRGSHAAFPVWLRLQRGEGIEQCRIYSLPPSHLRCKYLGYHG